MDPSDPPTRLPSIRPDLRPGTEFAGYRIERILGRGGMSVVYLAEHVRLERKVAVKVLAPAFADDMSFRERFVRESRMAASLDHPNVVPIYEADEADGLLFIAMRYVEGTDLRTLIREQGPLETARAVTIVEQAADALDAAHRKGLVHRDVKPGNVLLAERGSQGIDHVYLSDFGLTKRAASDSGITGTGQFVGTIDYAAPEQFESRRLDAATDVYSLGCVLYECLSGTPPFRRESDAAVMHAHLLEPPPSVTSVRPDLPAALDPVVARAMAKRSDDRYPTAGALASAARAAVGEIPAITAGAVPSRARRGRVVAGAIGLAAVIGIVALLLATRSDPGTGPAGRPSPNAIALPEHSVTEVDPTTREPLGDPIRFPPREATSFYVPRVAAGAGGVWVLASDLVKHVDPQRSEFEEEIPYRARGLIGTVPDLVAEFRTVWVTSGIGETESTFGAIERIDPATNEHLRQLGFPDTGGATGVAASRDAIWASFSDGTVVEIDPITLETRRTFELGGGLDAITVSDDAVWVADRLAGTVVRIDERTGEVGEPIVLGGTIDGIAAGGEEVWVLDALAGTVTQVGETGGGAIVRRVGEDATDISVSSTEFNELVWVTDGGGELYQIDPLSNTVSSTDLGAPLAAIAWDEERRSLWVLVE